ncbi:MAG: cobalamin-dependent protein, partial [Candidatus Omnitrophica bacterium]|nr:cobalamin-dependent protein [Candidatus Omnitrophota bacterium]
MAKKILFVHPPYISKVKSLPLGVAYLRSYLEKFGYDGDIIDMDPMALGVDEIEKEIKTRMPRFVAVSFMTVQANDAQKIAEKIKKVSKDIITVAGGVHASAMPHETLLGGNFDFVICGEGEQTLKELMDVLDRGGSDIAGVKGLAYLKNGEVVVNPPRELIEHIDELPFPDWRGLPIHEYSAVVLGSDDNSPVFPILSTRGCPYSCIFCASNIVFRRKYRARSNENILKEIVFLVKKYNAKNFDFVDDTLTIYKDKMKDLCDLIIREKIQINWICNARVNGLDR